MYICVYTKLVYVCIKTQKNTHIQTLYVGVNSPRALTHVTSRLLAISKDRGFCIIFFPRTEPGF